MIFLIDNHPSKKNVRAVVKPPKNYEVVCVNDKSESVITRDIHIKKTTTISQTSNVGRKKGKGRNVLTIISSKYPKTIEANDKGEERKCLKYNVVIFKRVCIKYVSLKEDIKTVITVKVLKK